MANLRRGTVQTITQISTNAASTDIDVTGYDYVDVIVILAAGTGSMSYQLRLEWPDGDQANVIEDGSATITKTATGTYAHRVEVGAATVLNIVVTDIGTSYTLNAKAYPFSRGDAL